MWVRHSPALHVSAQVSTSAHNQAWVWQVITSFLASTLKIRLKWIFFWRNLYGKYGPQQHPVPAVFIPHARPKSNSSTYPWLMCCLDQDWVLLWQEHKKIAIVDLCHPSNVHPDQFLSTDVCKQDGYSPMTAALSHFVDSGWTVHVFQCTGGRHSWFYRPHWHWCFPNLPENHQQTQQSSSWLSWCQYQHSISCIKCALAVCVAEEEQQMTNRQWRITDWSHWLAVKKSEECQCRVLCG